MKPIALASGLAFAAAFHLAAPIHAAPAQAECSEAYVRGQRLPNGGKMIEGRAQLVRCTEVCGGTFARECREWLRDLDRRMPSYVVRPQDGRGVDLAQANVTIDGVVAAHGVDARPLPLDPGTHHVKVECDGFVPVERDVTAVEGESGRVLILTLEAVPRSTSTSSEKAAPPAPEAKAVPWPVLALGGVALVSAGAFAFFGLRGEMARSDLDGTACAPRCDHGQVDEMRQSYLFADVALGTGLVAAAAAVVILVARPTPHPAAGRTVGARF